jgi:hypothetical protein
MKQLANTSFYEIGENELGNIYGGNSSRIYYVENGVLKWREVTS